MVPKKHILVVDDEEGMRFSLQNLLEMNGYQTSVASSAREALSLMQDAAVDLIICDVVMPDMGGLTFLTKVSGKVPVIMITAFASIDTARKAFKLGARDYLVKPFDFNELLIVLRQYMQTTPEMAPSEVEGSVFMESHSPEFQKLLRLADKISTTDIPVLILGESGTGKEVLANYIYARGARSSRPFVKVNCAAIPETLLESELFGYEKGAFTGAAETKIGLIEKANHGTFFLDEIGDMPLSLQAKLLRVLQNFRFSRLGSVKEIVIDCRIIAASNQNLRQHVEKSLFRKDLYYRINSAELNVPPLRDRMEDLPDLISLFLRLFGEKYGKNLVGLDDETLWVLNSYTWPGNLRELRNCLERAVVVCDESKIRVSDLPDSIANADPESDLQGVSSQSYRREYLTSAVVAALRKSSGNKSEAAKMLRVTRRTLYNWIRDLNLDL
jgi:DNA-binding NtrC family response regulator